MNYLESKTIPPAIPSRIVPWNNLQERLREGLNRKLTLVVSVAGSGKTTCLNHFFHAAVSFGHHAIWLSLDSRDNNYSQFWDSLFSALEKLELGLNTEGYPESKDRGTDKSWLIEALDRIAGAPFEIYLVLDNYQEITSPTIHDDLMFWIEHMPDNMHIAIASRLIPPLPLSRLRGQNQLVEIRSEHLFLDLYTTTKFLREIKGINASDEDIHSLYELTCGWIGGLQLASGALQSLGDTPSAPLTPVLTNRYIKDYLIEEVFSQQEQHIRDFLLKTSILNRLTEELCVEVTGCKEHEHVLDVLVRAGLFITPLDERGEYFCYHPLFAKVLRQHLNLVTPEEIPLLYTRASEWFERKGFLDDAIEYALAAEDDDRVIRLFERSMFEVFDKIEGQFFVLDESRQRGWLSSLSEERFSESTPFLLLNAWSNFVASRPRESNLYLTKVRQSLTDLQSEDSSSVLPAHLEEILSAIEAGNANMDGDYYHAIELSQNALSDFHGGSVWFRVTLLCLLGEALASVGDIDESMRSYNRAKAVSVAFGGNQLEQFCSYEIGKLYFQQGQLDLALETWKKALPSLGGDKKFELYSVGLLYVGLGRLNVFRGNLEDATEYLKQAQSLLLKSKNLFCHLELQIAFAYLYKVQGNSFKAYNTIAAASELALSSYSDIAPRYSAWETFICHAKIALSNGDPATAQAALAKLDRHLSPNNSYYKMQAELIRASILYMQFRNEEALKALALVSYNAQKAGYYGISQEVMVVRAACLYDLGKIDVAVIELTLALDAADRGDYVLPFMLGTPAIEELLYRILYERGGKAALSVKRRTLCRDLLSIRKLQRADKGSQTKRVTASLSKREVEILKLLEQGLNKQEIADSLHISFNTVKTHVKNIYKKLEVHNRAAAAQISPDFLE
ncbi:MAG: LuxR C-terminal-related transcriptional regulator [Eggerthellaceae bacterium]|nr:LuxR C-terminal-related transcriptional regulator [Eggerthellaceae bacterium]